MLSKLKAGILFTLALLTPINASAGKPMLGISLNVKEGGGAKELIENFLTVKKLGVNFMFVSKKWSELEAEKGKREFKKLLEDLKNLKAQNMKACLTLQTLDTTNRTLPKDLTYTEFDSKAMLERFEGLLDELIPQLPDNVLFISLGNEADIYLSAHPKETNAYLTFLETGRKKLKSLDPKRQVGVTATFNGLVSNPALVKKLHEKMDFVPMTYYPLDAEFNVRPISEVGKHFDQMVELAQGKLLLLQEIGYPADAILQSSEEKQAAFIDAVFDAVKAKSDKIAAFSFFLMVDFNRALLKQLTDYYELDAPKFQAFLATLGLQKSDGTPRKAWNRFEVRARQWSNDPASKKQ